MRRVFVLIVLFGLIIFRASNALANFEELDKLKRGVVNIVTSPSEIPKQVQENNKDTSMKQSKRFFGGIIKGVDYMVRRVLSGAWDVFTFNIEKPKNFEPLMKPDYAYDAFAGKQETRP